MIIKGGDKIYLSPNKTFLMFCFSFLLGTAIASLIFEQKIELNILFILILILIFCFSFFWYKPLIRFILGSFLFLTLGVVSLLNALPEEKKKDSISFFYEEKIILEAEVVSEPVRKISQAEYELGNLIVGQEKIKGKILLNLSLYPELNYQDKLKISCQISLPKNYSDFRYDRYLAMRKIQATCFSPEILSIKSTDKKNFYGKILFFKEKIREKVFLLWPEPNSSFMAGITYGERSGFPEKLKEDFNRVGLTHLVAVSGYNVSVIAGFILVILIYLGFYRKTALFLAISGIILYVVFVGAFASAVRAGIMGIIILIGQFLGRPTKAVSSLILAATIMVAVNPLILFWDAGFQLSCLATAGIIFSPRIENIWLEPAKTTLAATLATLPLILYQFSKFSLVSLPINILVIWLIPWLMLLGFIAVFASFIFYNFGLFFAYFANLGLSYVIFLTEKISAWQYTMFDVSIKFWQVILLYVMIILILKKIKKYESAQL